jgi:hydrogenase maturation factor HypF (carbamoyltransferase family)
MSIEEEFKEYKKAQLKKARVLLMAFGIVAIIGLVSTAYVFFERSVVARERMHVMVLEKDLAACQDQLEKTQKIAAAEAARANEEALEAAILRDHIEKSNPRK